MLGLARATLSRPSSDVALGGFAHDPTHLRELKIDTVDLKYSPAEHQLETGKLYLLTVSCDGEEDTAFMAPDFSAHYWIDRIVSGENNGNEVHAQSIYSLECDGEGSRTIRFIPIRLGEYRYYTPGYEERGPAGKFLVTG